MRPINIFEILKKRQRIKFASVFFVLAIFLLFVGTNFWQRTHRVSAVDHIVTGVEYLGVGEDNFAGQEVEVANGGRLVMDGEHNFAKLTVKSGGVVTSTDYNLYGFSVGRIERDSNPSQCGNGVVGDGIGIEECSRRALSLIRSDNGEYLLQVGGFLWLDNPNLDNYIALGRSYSYATSLANFRVDDYAYVEFFKPITGSEITNYDYSNGNLFSPEGSHLYSSINQDSNKLNLKTLFSGYSGRQIIPFRLSYYNTTGPSYWSLGVCYNCSSEDINTSSKYLVPTLRSNHGQGAWTPNGVSFQVDTKYAIQSNSARYYSYLAGFNNSNYLGYWSNFAQNFYINRLRLYYVDDYNYLVDKIVYPSGYNFPLSTSNLNNPQLAIISRLSDYHGDKFRFYDLSGLHAPLSQLRNFQGEFPFLSQQLIESLKRNGNYNGVSEVTERRLVIKVSGDLVVTGGQINVNGKGFAQHAGPGAGAAEEGASHAGQGWGNSQGYVYDNVADVEPIAPGSGGYYANSPNYDFNRSFCSYGGGYVKVEAGYIYLRSYSVVSADGMGISRGGPEGAGTGSGGSIILIETGTEAVSDYTAAITAWGGGSDDKDGRTSIGGGGGGHIYISSNLPPSYFAARVNRFYNPYYNELVEAGKTRKGGALRIVEGDYSAWLNNTGRAAKTQIDSSGLGVILVTGGESEFDNNNGEWGVISIIYQGVVDSGVSISKSLRKVVGTGSPYSVQPGDILEVTLNVNNLIIGQPITISDQLFNDAGTNYSIFVPESCSDSCTVSGSQIDFVLTPESRSKVLRYQVKIK